MWKWKDKIWFNMDDVPTRKYVLSRLAGEARIREIAYCSNNTHLLALQRGFCSANHFFYSVSRAYNKGIKNRTIHNSHHQDYRECTYVVGVGGLPMRNNRKSCDESAQNWFRSFHGRSYTITVNDTWISILIKKSLTFLWSLRGHWN